MQKRASVALIVLFIGLSLALQYKVRLSTTPPPGLAVNAPAPNFGRNDTTGRYIVLNELKGQTVVLLFSSFDAPASREMVDALKRWVEEKQQSGQWQRMMLVAFNEGDYRETQRLKDLGLPFTMCSDYNGELRRKYNVRKLPSLFVVGPDGLVRKFQEGYTPELITGLETVVEQIRKEKKS